jgi:hypothetical protein
MSAAGSTAYYNFGDIRDNGSTRTGLQEKDIVKGYFC